MHTHMCLYVFMKFDRAGIGVISGLIVYTGFAHPST